MIIKFKIFEQNNSDFKIYKIQDIIDKNKSSGVPNWIEIDIKKELIEKILDKYVIFKTISSGGPFSEKIIKGFVEGVFVKWIPQHGEYWVIFKINDNNQYVIPNKNILVYDIERKKNIIDDPYGEENWDDEEEIDIKFDKNLLKENDHYDIDPYGEEDWYEYIDVTCDNVKVGDEIYSHDEYIGTVVEIDYQIKIMSFDSTLYMPLSQFDKYEFKKRKPLNEGIHWWKDGKLGEEEDDDIPEPKEDFKPGVIYCIKNYITDDGLKLFRNGRLYHIDLISRHPFSKTYHVMNEYGDIELLDYETLKQYFIKYDNPI